MSHSVRYRNNHLTYFSLYSSRTGGPQPWIKEPRSHFHRLAVEGDDDSVVSLTSRLQHPGGYPTGENFAFQVTCAKLGTVDLILIVGNEKSLTLPKPGSCLSLTFFSTFTKITLSCFSFSVFKYVKFLSQFWHGRRSASSAASRTRSNLRPKFASPRKTHVPSWPRLWAVWQPLLPITYPQLFPCLIQLAKNSIIFQPLTSGTMRIFKKIDFM